ncbi:hypothetical protein PTKIN_Ptkin14bG0131400 [Pterospermum kingtungense]
MASPPSASDNHEIKFPQKVDSLFYQEYELEESPSTPSNVTYNFHDLQTLMLVYLMGLMLFFFFYLILNRFRNWNRNRTLEQDIELGDIVNHRSLASHSDSADEVTVQNNLQLLEILDMFMALLEDRQGLSSEDLEKVLPLVHYKSLGKTSDECVICLDDLEDDELCRVFPVCKHVFHFSCIDNWLKNHITCPICRNSIVAE